MNTDTTNATIRAEVLAALGELAPEVHERELDPQADLLDELDLDSMDLLNLVTDLSTRLGIDIPDRDQSHMRTLDGAVDYLAARTTSPPG